MLFHVVVVNPEDGVVINEVEVLAHDPTDAISKLSTTEPPDRVNISVRECK